MTNQVTKAVDASKQGAEVQVPDTSVAICYPTAGGVHVLFHRSIMELHEYDREQGWNNLVAEKAVISGANISKARNELVTWVLDKIDEEVGQPVEWIWFVDTDMVVEKTVLPRLLCSAKISGAKVIGGLCCMIDDADGPIPTIYQLGNFSQGEITRVVFDYAEDNIEQVAATGAACLLIHRSVLEDIRARNPQNPFPWFQEEVINGNWVSEDLRFCLLANSLGHPVFVDCTTHIGHAKGSTVWWPKDIKTGRGFPRLKNFAVIPVKNKLQITRNLIEQLREQGDCHKIIVCDNGSGTRTRSWLDKQDDLVVLDCPDQGIHEMWNAGVEWVVENAGHRRNVNIAFLNNDLKIGPRFISGLSGVLRDDKDRVAVSPNYDGRENGGEDFQRTDDICANRYDGSGGFAGFAFLVRGEWFQSGYRFPETCKWWFGDNDLVRGALFAGGHVGIALNTQVEHLDGGGKTAGNWSKFAEQIEKDREAYEARWLEIEGQRPPATLDEAYQQVCARPSDINEHLSTLVELCRRTEAKQVIELGVRGGTSTVAWLYGLCETDGHLTSVDVNQPPPIRHSRWTFVLGEDTDPFVLAQMPEEVDIVFVDTDHRYELTLDEIKAYVGRVRAGGCMVFHDTNVETFEHHAPGQPPYPVRQAVQELLGGESPIREVTKIETYENNHGLTVVWF